MSCVHTAHCCVLHGGCKYGDEDCPVVKGYVDQEYVCEQCGSSGIENLEDLQNELSLRKNNSELKKKALLVGLENIHEMKRRQWFESSKYTEKELDLMESYLQDLLRLFGENNGN